MVASIISIGDELLIGQVVNTNASWLGRQLTELGYEVRSVLAIGDDQKTIGDEIVRAAAGDDVVIVSGGLGPTHDDMTKPALCGLLDCDLQLDEAQLERIRRRFADRGLELNQRSHDQALVPSACRVLPNEYGSAPGLAFEYGKARVYVLPGVPAELRGIFTDHIASELASAPGDIASTTFICFGIAESKLADELTDVYELLDATVTLAFLPSYSGIRLRAMRHGSGASEQERYTKLLEAIRRQAAPWLIAEGDKPLAMIVGEALAGQGLTLGVAESCTGGLISSMLTEISGSSRYFLGGVVSYANSVKSDLLGVSMAEIEEHGAVSREVAEAMAAGVRESTGSDIGVAVTGIAGPEGGSAEKPVGTVWIGVASSAGVQAVRHQLGNERQVVRERSAYIALDMVRREVVRLADMSLEQG
jgi:nicotinamide-nucleotide amidase